jgi:ribose transport system ATP-binding protein
MFGALRPDRGSILLDNKKLPETETVAKRISRGIVLLPSDRIRESIFSGMSITENLFPNPGITGIGSWAFTSPRQERNRTRPFLDRFDVRPRNEAALIDWLSGGNQQKVAIARWLAANGRVLILEEPTAGVDIGAKLAIHGMIRDAAREGAAVLVVSSDFEEVAVLCDRALVVSRGRIAGQLQGTRLTVDELVARSSLGFATAAAK